MQYFVPSLFSDNQTFYKSAIVFAGTQNRTELSIGIKSTHDGSVDFDRKKYGNDDWLKIYNSATQLSR